MKERQGCRGEGEGRGVHGVAEEEEEDGSKEVQMEEVEQHRCGGHEERRTGRQG